MEPLTAGDPRTVGDFRLWARLGAGGMGRVYIATSLAGRFVAIKVIHPEFSGDQDFARRFRGEADAAKRVSGVYTAAVVAAGVEDKQPWLATAFVPGPSLESMISQYRPLPLPALWRLGAGLAEALRAIHSVGVVHRDLKPPNVILASDGPRVIDFGIARAVADDRMTATGSVVGTPAYMSPEQVAGQEAGPPADVFALGCVLGFAASGRSPFDGGPHASAASIMYRVAHGEPDLGTVPPEARGLIAACLAKDPARRPGTGQIAAQCAAATGPAGMSPTAFWPDDVATVIRSQQAAVNAQVQALVTRPQAAPPAGPPGPGNHPATQFAGQPWPGTHPGTQLAGWPGPGTHPATQLAGFGQAAEFAAPPGGPVPGAPTATIGPGAPAGPPFTGAPGAPWAPPQPQPYPGRPAPAPEGTSRRGLLIGAGIGVVAAIGGGTAWALSGGSGAAKPGPGTAVWSFSAGSQQVDANPTAAGGVVYFGGSNDALCAVKVATGEEAWVQSVSKISAAPTAAGEFVFASADNGDFDVFHATTGMPAWSVSSGGNGLDPFQADFATDGRRVAIAPGDRSLSMYDAATGARIWAETTSVDSGFGQTVAMNGNVVYAFGQLGTLVALSAANGRQIGEFGMLGDGIGTGMIISDGILYFGCATGTLYAFDTKRGRVKWTHKAERETFASYSNLAAADGMLYFADSSGLVHAVSAADGRQAWEYPAGEQDLTGPAVGGGQVYVLVNKSTLQQLDAKTGKPGWSFTLSTQVPFASTPAVADGLVFCGNGDGSLYAIKA